MVLKCIRTTLTYCTKDLVQVQNQLYDFHQTSYELHNLREYKTQLLMKRPLFDCVVIEWRDLRRFKSSPAVSSAMFMHRGWEVNDRLLCCRVRTYWRENGNGKRKTSLSFSHSLSFSLASCRCKMSDAAQLLASSWSIKTQTASPGPCSLQTRPYKYLIPLSLFFLLKPAQLQKRQLSRSIIQSIIQTIICCVCVLWLSPLRTICCCESIWPPWLWCVTYSKAIRANWVSGEERVK